MKKSLLYISILTLLNVSLVACATQAVNRHFPTQTKNIQYQNIQSDNIVHLGKIQQNQNIVFIGEKYIYLITHGQHEFQQLSQHFKPQELLLTNHLPLALHLNTAQDFDVVLTFIYPIPYQQVNPQQAKILQDLGFSPYFYHPNSQDKQRYYGKNMQLAGTIYQKSISKQHITATQNMNLPIMIQTSQHITQQNPQNTAIQTLLKPLAIGLDIIASPFYFIYLSHEIQQHPY